MNGTHTTLVAWLPHTCDLVRPSCEWEEDVCILAGADAVREDRVVHAVLLQILPPTFFGPLDGLQTIGDLGLVAVDAEQSVKLARGREAQLAHLTNIFFFRLQRHFSINNKQKYLEIVKGLEHPAGVLLDGDAETGRDERDVKAYAVE